MTRRLLLTAVLSLAIGPVALSQAPGVPAEVSAAQAHFTAGNMDSTIALLEAFFARTPNAVTGRLLLGNAWKQKGDLDRALAAFLAVTLPRANRLQARFNAAGIHALRGNVDEAVPLLAEVKASGAFDMDLIRTTADFSSVASHPGILPMMFRPEEFVNPFVEPVRVIHEWRAESKGDQFSWIARGIGDVDGDRVNDIVTSAPTYGAAGQPRGRGRVYVYSGRSGKLVWMQTGETGDNLGSGLESAGDVNKDGVQDVIAGAPGGNRVLVYSGRDGTRLLTIAGPGQNEFFGSSASGAGDQNGDGIADLIVGAPGSNAVAQGAGRAYVFSGKDGAALLTLDGEATGDAFGSIVGGERLGTRTRLLVGAPGAGAANRGRVYMFASGSRAPTYMIDADSTGTALGAMFTSFVGDLDKDGVRDIYSTDFVNALKGPSTGRAYVHSGATGRPLRVFSGENAGDGLGAGSAELGDLNRDGVDDLVVGAWQYSAAAASGGRIYVYSGRDGSVVRTITGRVPGETLGFDATGIGDVDGDGTPDLLVAASWSNINGFRSGRMYVISGRN